MKNNFPIIQKKRKRKNVSLWNYFFLFLHGPKSNQSFRDITRNVEEKKILHEIFRVVSRLPRYILCYFSENYLWDSDSDKLWLPDTYWSYLQLRIKCVCPYPIVEHYWTGQLWQNLIWEGECADSYDGRLPHLKVFLCCSWQLLQGKSFLLKG